MSGASKNPAQTPPGFHRDMPVAEIMALFPGAAEIMAECGLHCFSCAFGGSETFEEGCRLHDFTEEMIDELLEDLNTAFRQAPSSSQDLHITKEAARNMVHIAQKEGHAGDGLQVTVDEQGSFCMEFRKEPEGNDRVFSHEEMPEMRVFASPLTLMRIGGATVDFRDGGFKLDLAE